MSGKFRGIRHWFHHLCLMSSRRLSWIFVCAFHRQTKTELMDIKGLLTPVLIKALQTVVFVPIKLGTKHSLPR